MKQVVAAIMVREPDKKILICQRTKDQPLPLKWEFPGGKIEEGEEPRAALARELEEELGIRAEIGEEVSRFVHHYRNGGGVELGFFLVTRYAGDIDNKIFKDVRWVDRKDLPRFDFLEADIKLVKQIAAGDVI
jgi:8-oxo-dGTP diphosphatase